MAKCNECRSGDTHPLCGDDYSCVNCGHTGPAALPTPVESDEPDEVDE